MVSRIYEMAEWCEKPLNFLLNDIVARVKTVLTPGEFGNYSSRSLEVMRRLFLLCISPFVAALALAGSLTAIVIKLVGDIFLGNQPYLRFLGTYSGPKKETFATFNMSMLLLTMTLTDGVSYSRDRWRKIADELREFHFVCGQEVGGEAARFLSSELKSNFKEFYTYLGKSNTPLIPSGLFFASKEKVKNVTVIPFTGAEIQKTIRRELTIFELEDYYVAMMHLDGGEGEQAVKTHVQEIRQATSVLLSYNKPVILCGDFNEDRYAPTEAYAALTEHFVDIIKEQRPNEKIITCTDALKIARFGEAALPTKQSIDYITYLKNQEKLKLRFIDVDYNFDLSDHSLVKGEIEQAEDRFRLQPEPYTFGAG